MATTIYPRKVEMNVTYAPSATPAASAFRISADGAFVQIKDRITGKWRSMWIANGVAVFGAEEN